MLRRFEAIKDCGIFEAFRWNTSSPDFERINLIYGANGAGKTSLARALDGLHRESGGFAKVSIRMSNEDKTNDRETTQTHDDEFERVFVFSDGYVSRNHNFGGDTEVEAVLTLGERTVEDEKRITKLNELIDQANGDLIKATKAARDAAKSLEDEFTSIARGVVTALGRAGGDYRSNGTYSQASAKTRFSESHAKWTLLSDKDKEAALAIVNSDERQEVPTKSFSFTVREELSKELADALASSPVSVVLDTLKNHEDASSWVDSGRQLHNGLNQCIFCGGDLTDHRKQQIEQHFSDEVEHVQSIIDALIREVTAGQTSVTELLGDKASSGLLFEDLREGFKDAYDLAKVQVDSVQEWLTEALEALKQKRANVVARVEYEVVDAPSVNGSTIESILKTHNDRVSKHAELAQAAAKMVELHLLKEGEAKIANLEKKSKGTAKVQSDLEETLAKHREEVAALENVEGDPLPSAVVMARELTRILGRNELKFELLSGGKQYRITRLGRPARDLSAGERTAITLIHFLERVKRAGIRAGKPIVVIDDPVSSLDGGTAMGISTYIWSETVSKDHVEQIFLLTHNFEFFRQWDIQIRGLPGKRGSANKRGYASNCYELTAPHQNVSGNPTRVPEFHFWPPSEDARLKVRSAYHHAFIATARAYLALDADPKMEKKLDALLLYPNVLRRMLETFLAFKRPASVGDFTSAMRDIGTLLEEADYEGDADALRLQLTRFTHSNSHADSPETDVTIDPDEIGATIAAVFTFMNAIDQEHFNGLCEVIGIEPAALLLEAQPVANHKDDGEEV